MAKITENTLIADCITAHPHVVRHALSRLRDGARRNDRRGGQRARTGPSGTFGKIERRRRRIIERKARYHRAFLLGGDDAIS